MKMRQSEPASLRSILGALGDPSTRVIAAPHARVSLKDARAGHGLAAKRAKLRGRAVLVAPYEQMGAALALIALDGSARRLVLLPPGVASEHVAAMIASGVVDAMVSDSGTSTEGLPPIENFPIEAADGIDLGEERPAGQATEWVLLTSGTTGMPKLVSHSLASLTGAIVPTRAASATGAAPIIWSTFYDIRRYGGLQIFLRALLAGASMVLSDSGEATASFLLRAQSEGVTHISGTPSHWRRALMSPAIAQFSPGYVRLSGEIADQAILDSLKHAFPKARIGHAFASTEAGVGFEVTDGLAGFPASWIGRKDGSVELNVVDGTLRIRSPRRAARYLGAGDGALGDSEGFVDTGDLVELRGDRYYFMGRRGGIVNIGGLKVYPEEIEAVINSHPSVEMAQVKARRSSITGALVVADVVLKSEAEGDQAALKESILELCRGSLDAFKVPAIIRFVPSLEITASGKMARAND